MLSECILKRFITKQERTEKTLSAYLRHYQLFKDIFSLPLSEGSIDNILEEMSQKSEVAYHAIQERIVRSEVVGSDETGSRVNGKKHWFHVWQNKFLTFIVSFASRGHNVNRRILSRRIFTLISCE
jgi:hypothetical protein